MEKGDLYPNIYYKDVFGSLTLFCQNNGLTFKILDSTDLKVFQLNLIDNKPFMYHYHRGSGKDSKL